MSSVAVVPSTQELVLGRYRPVRPLGSGGSGSVWLALDEQNGLDVALKIIPREGKAAARAEREALAARRLRHDRCVRAYDVGHDSGHVYIAYEYVPGRTMREAIRAGALSDQDAVEAATQVLDALAHAHRAGIVHRDVKPANILLEDRDEITVRLLDFGLAQFDGADTLTAVGDVPGTLAYIAPERLAGGDATPQSDVWSVGVLLWETLTDRHPFWGMPIQEVARAIQAGAPPLASERRGLPRRLVTAVDTALAIDPKARPSASDLAAELRNAARKPQERATRKTMPAVEPEASVAPARRHARRVLPVVLERRSRSARRDVPSVLASRARRAPHRRDRRRMLARSATRSRARPRRSDPPARQHRRRCGDRYTASSPSAWLALNWRDARHGLWFMAGPLLAGVGLLALVPLALIPVRSTARRAAHGVLAVLAAVLLAAVAGDALPIDGNVASALGLSPLDSPLSAAASVWSWLASTPLVIAGAILVGAAAALLPWARRRSRGGVAGIGFVVTAGSVLAGAGVASTIVVMLVWGGFALAAAAPRRA